MLIRDSRFYNERFVCGWGGSSKPLRCVTKTVQNITKTKQNVTKTLHFYTPNMCLIAKKCKIENHKSVIKICLCNENGTKCNENETKCHENVTFLPDDVFVKKHRELNYIYKLRVNLLFMVVHMKVYEWLGREFQGVKRRMASRHAHCALCEYIYIYGNYVRFSSILHIW